MTIEKITDHQTRAKNRLPGFMQGATNIESFIDALVAECQTLETVFCQLLDERHLSVAIGKQLDGIGEILDLDREVAEIDGDYRARLIAKSGQLTRGGEIETLLSTFVSLTGLTAPDELSLSEIFPCFVIMTWLTDVVDDLDPVLDAELISTMNAVRAAGVRLDLIRNVLAEPFEFSDESEIVGGNGPIDASKGFGDEVLTGGGKLGRVITVIPALPPLSGPSTSGYTSGGGSSDLDIIDKFPFPTDGNATDVGDLSTTRNDLAGHSSTENGYTSGGHVSFNQRDVIDKFPFATDSNATDIANLSTDRALLTGQSSNDDGYTSGGFFGSQLDTIDKFPFATETNATDIANLTLARRDVAGQSSSENGYTSGGYTTGIINIIDKFPFATDSNATDVGDLTVTRRRATGNQSTVSGYTTGGYTTSPVNVIDKFPFATNDNATDVGDLTDPTSEGTGQSSSENGYATGGESGGLNAIDKFSFSSDGNSTDIGDLTVDRNQAAGQQY